jgi:RND family efflux transporter MFP subunit
MVSPIAQASEGLVRAATRCAAAGADIPAQVVKLTEEVTRAMFVKKMTTVAVLVAVAGAFLFGGALTMQIQAGGEERRNQVTGRAERPAGEPKQVTVDHPTWYYPRPFEDFLGRLEMTEVVSVRSRVSGTLCEIHFKVGEIVKQGDLLFEVGPAEVFKAQLEKAEVETAQKAAHHKAKQVELKSAEQRFAAGALPRAVVEQYTAKVNSAAEALQVARAALETARHTSEVTKISAPVAGRVVERTASLQDRIEANVTLLAKIAPAGRLSVHFDMDERSLLRYRRLVAERKIRETGGPLYVGLADEDGLPHEATLSSFASRVNAANGTIGVYATLANPGGIFLPGMSARVRIPFTKQRRTLAVPDGAVHTEQGKSYVWLVGKGDVAERRDVKAGTKEGRLRLIESGLRPDESVITGGTEGLRPGDRVEPRRPAAKE